MQMLLALVLLWQEIPLRPLNQKPLTPECPLRVVELREMELRVVELREECPQLRACVGS
jgi:hypothetical protein